MNFSIRKNNKSMATFGAKIHITEELYNFIEEHTNLGPRKIQDEIIGYIAFFGCSEERYFAVSKDDNKLTVIKIYDDFEPGEGQDMFYYIGPNLESVIISK